MSNPLPELDIAPVGTGRLQPHWYVTSSGDPLTISGPLWRDTDVGKDCVRYDTVAEGARCIPNLETLDARFGTFADAGCTQRLILRNTDPCFAIEPPELFGEYTGGVCGPGPLSELRTVEGEHLGDIYWKNEASCTPQGRADDVAYYLVGEERSFADYAEITTDP
ncbi:MAG: hypothetical protein AAF211_10555 [Myxococcota bacterium]